MIDPNQPLELDDGTPVTFVAQSDGSIQVRLPRGARWSRGKWQPVATRPVIFWYRETDGVFEGRDAETHFVLRNSFSPSDVQLDKDWS